MRKIRYSCAMSLDGYIAGPAGEYDWIVMDPGFDFPAIFEQFDTYLLGRKTFEVTGAQVSPVASGIRTYVFSKTLRQSDFQNVPIIGDNWKELARLCLRPTRVRKRAARRHSRSGLSSTVRSESHSRQRLLALSRAEHTLRSVG